MKVKGRRERAQRQTAAVRIQCMIRRHIALVITKNKRLERDKLIALQLSSALQIQKVYRGHRGRRRVREFKSLQSILKHSPRFPEALKALEVQIAPLTLDDLIHMDPEDMKEEDMIQILDTARKIEAEVSISYT